MKHIDTSQSKARSDSRPLLAKKGRRLGPRPAKNLTPRKTAALMPPPEAKHVDQEALLRSLRGIRDSFAALPTWQPSAPLAAVDFACARKQLLFQSEPEDKAQEDAFADSMAKAAAFRFRSRSSDDMPDDLDAPFVTAPSQSSNESVTELPAPPRPSQYVSPLFALRASRLSEDFQADGSKRSSKTWSHRIDPFRIICPFEQSGSCNDPNCAYQHTRDYTWDSDQAILADMGSYFGDKEIQEFISSLSTSNLCSFTA
jgi:hypothetical protein